MPWAESCYARLAATWWENQRRKEDRAEMRRKPPIGPACRLNQRPPDRRLTAAQCRGCGEAYVFHPNRADSGYCTVCQRRRWRKQTAHTRRMRIAAAIRDVVSPDEVYRRDGYRCQVCDRPTTGTWPALDAPSLDHKVPLSKGGEHSYQNVRLLCNECNTLKGDKLHDRYRTTSGFIVSVFDA